MRSAQTRDDNAATGMLAKNSPSHAYRARYSKSGSAWATTAAFDNHGIVKINQKQTGRTSSIVVGAGYLLPRIICICPRGSGSVIDACSYCLHCCSFTSRSRSIDLLCVNTIPPLLNDAGVRLELEGTDAISVDAATLSAHSLKGAGPIEFELHETCDRRKGSTIKVVSGTENFLAQSSLS